MAEQNVVLLDWPSTQDNFGIKTKLSPEGQLRVAKDLVEFALKRHTADHPGQGVVFAFAFGGYVPHDG